jgi:hypothetical protein
VPERRFRHQGAARGPRRPHLRGRAPRSPRPRDRTPPRAYPGNHHRARERALSENGTTGTGAGDDDAVLLFVGGPLDGRVEVRAARHGEPPQTVTHVHLHDGPKVVHRYDLQPLPRQTGVYHVRPRGGSSAEQDESAD